MKIYNINIYYIMIFLLIFVILIFYSIFTYASKDFTNHYFIKNNDIWNKNLNNTTWISDNSRSKKYVFYTDSKGNKKCVSQLEVGSGLIRFITDYPEFKILGANKFKIWEDIYEFKEDKLISKNETLTFDNKETIVYYDNGGKIDVKYLENNDKNSKFGGKFKVYLMNKSEGNYFFIKNNYTDSERKDLLEKSKLGTLLFTDNNIEKYDWTNQTITLNLKPSNLKPSNLEKLNDFIITLDGKKLYLGTITSNRSSMGINHPVIYIDYEKDSKIKIILRPYNTGTADYSEVEENLRNKIEFQDIKNYFLSLGKLSEEFIGTLLEIPGGYAVVDNVYIPDFKEKGYEKYLNKKVEVSGKISISRYEYRYINTLMNVIKNPKISLVPEYQLNYENTEYKETELKVLELGKKAIIEKFGQEAFDAQTPFAAEINNDNEWYTHGTTYQIINGKKVKIEGPKIGGGTLTVEFTKDLEVSKVYYSK